MFLSWKVIQAADKKYYYECECVECGSVRKFNKYNLLAGSYKPCKGCANKHIKDMDLLKRYWNVDLNGEMFTFSSTFNISKKYWFKCSNGHNFKSNLKNFSLKKCTSCNRKVNIDNTKGYYFEILNNVLTNLFEVVELMEYNIFYLPIYNVAIRLVEKDRYSNYKKYFNSENDMLEEFYKVRSFRDHNFSGAENFYIINSKDSIVETVDAIGQVANKIYIKAIDT